MSIAARSLISPFDLHLFNEGTHSHLFDKLGAHPAHDPEGTYFAVWAPNADAVSVIGDFNGWDKNANGLYPREQSGIWEGFIPTVRHGALYKYYVHSKVTRNGVDKADPFATYSEAPPRQASVVWDLDYDWGDQGWMENRRTANHTSAPWSVYEMHLGSWMRVPEEGNRWFSYRELAPRLADYVSRMGFTHVEFMPVMEHPLYESWGYQVTGYFAPTSRYGTPQDFMFLVDYLHQNGIGVILDWVPSHFPADEFGLQNFDGTHLFEHADPRLGVHPDWGSSIFNYGRNEVRGFLVSSALCWLDRYHADGLRVDAVASMLYLDYSRKQGEWIPNKFGGRENLEAVDFLRRFNIEVYKEQPDTQTVAEESTAWPLVSRPTYVGGLGFGMKWDMGWMHDTLYYFEREPVHRRFHHSNLTFRMLYAFGENFMLPLSHDEVVHGKGSLLAKMPGDEWQKFANLRVLYGWMYAQPGKKLVFMGGEFGQWKEWDVEQSLDWHLLDYPMHGGLRLWVGDLNRILREEKALHEMDFDPRGFQWIDVTDADHSVVSLIRRGKMPEDIVVAVFNFTPVPRHNYQIGIPGAGWWAEVLNSDAPLYGGSGMGNMGGVEAVPVSMHGHSHSVTLTLPPLGALFLKPARGEPPEAP
ncbi:MAG: 1,4-alpha-glucan branching enzyme [Chloroflexi bacterium 13_1_40CM_4_65_16]|nr:MAG: 1,4-alpha-glucan branching enzyme [Chloroflexi bacterium 13_1_40CM_66_19]OLC45912.1 MAG: 1,4-alpha-glucan branching enzyme [Chloroflexi bacterium 13_1_40CM_4_65_16]OLD06362.1 MAG: 1,4-alpha-glucan branching enzyme [Actinobacteria bacterium 13_1_40CM_3_66_19]TMF71087.1 MAG: 1,4-alpha-glucan branching protein GlgB [Chloroflexota bacterium]TMF87936.1 MAG: 1,4-alpha-glucan branching protein GlgB [Chloroflexota bacterium]